MPEVLHLDTELARKADRLYRELGLDLPTAIHLFLRQSLRDNGLPFTPRLHAPLPPEQEDEGEERPAASAPAEGPEQRWGELADLLIEGEGPEQDAAAEHGLQAAPEGGPVQDSSAPAVTADAPLPDLSSDAPSPAMEKDAPSAPPAEQASELRQTFLEAGVIGAPLRRVRSLNRLYAIGEANPHVQGWREVYLSGDEPFALDFGPVRLELAFREGGSMRMMNGRLPDEVLEADAVFPRDLSAVFSAAIGQPLTDVTSARIRQGGEETEQLRLHFANGCCLNFAPGGDWGALWLTDARGSVMYAPDGVWRRVLGERAWQALH